MVWRWKEPWTELVSYTYPCSVWLRPADGAQSLQSKVSYKTLHVEKKVTELVLLCILQD